MIATRLVVYPTCGCPVLFLRGPRPGTVSLKGAAIDLGLSSFFSLPSPTCVFSNNVGNWKASSNITDTKEKKMKVSDCVVAEHHDDLDIAFTKKNWLTSSAFQHLIAPTQIQTRKRKSIFFHHDRHGDYPGTIPKRRPASRSLAHSELSPDRKWRLK